MFNRFPIPTDDAFSREFAERVIDSENGFGIYGYEQEPLYLVEEIAVAYKGVSSIGCLIPRDGYVTSSWGTNLNEPILKGAVVVPKQYDSWQKEGPLIYIVNNAPAIVIPKLNPHLLYIVER